MCKFYKKKLTNKEKQKQKNYINVLTYFFLFSLLIKVALSAKIQRECLKRS